MRGSINQLNSIQLSWDELKEKERWRGGVELFQQTNNNAADENRNGWSRIFREIFWIVDPFISILGFLDLFNSQFFKSILQLRLIQRIDFWD